MPEPDPEARAAVPESARDAGPGPAPGLPVTPGRWITLSRRQLVPLLVLAALLALFTRRPDQFVRPQFWAEDGSVFFREAELDGWSSLWRPYHGYLHGIPRLVAIAGRSLPWEWLPAAFALAAAAGTLYVVARTATARLPAIVAGFGAAAVVMVPHNGEVWLNLCCFHVIGAVLLAVNLLEPAPATRAEGWRRSGEVVAIGLSGPEICLAIPFFLLRGWHWRRERLAGPVVFGGLAVAAVQSLILLFSPVRSTLAAPGLLLGGLPTAAGRSLQFLAPGGLAGAVVIGLAACFVAVFVLVALDTAAAVRWRVLLLLGGALAILLAARRAWPDWSSVLMGTRFAYLGAVLLALAIGWLGAGARRPLARAGVALLALIVLSFSIRHWQGFLPPDLGWADQVRAAREGRRSEFMIPPGWHFPVPRTPAAPRQP